GVGARVEVFDLQGPAAARVARHIGGKDGAGDVTSESDVAQAASAIERGLAPIDILVNNAGITGRAANLWELKKTDLESVLAVNVVGPFLCCRAVIGGMLQRGYGRIVNIAS